MMGMFGFFGEGDGGGFGFIAWAALILAALVIVPSVWQGVAFFAVVWLVAKIVRTIGRMAG